MQVEAAQVDAALTIDASAEARSPAPPGYQTVTVGPYGGEPSIVSDPSGNLYIATPSGGTLTYRSGDRGRTWAQVTTADPNSGDDCLASDQSGAIYLCNL